MEGSRAEGFGVLLRRLRLAAGLTQEELAERAGLSVRGLSDLERGINRAPRRETVQLLATALSLPPDEHAALGTAARRHSTTTTVTSAVAAGAAPPPPHNLPLPPTPLVGRERELATVLALLAQPGLRLLTLSGTPGVGKTRLALEVAVQVYTHYADGVVLVPLAPVQDAALVLTTLAQALGLHETGARPLAESVQEHLRHRRMLLLLDNCEHVLAAASQLAALLASCSRLTVLATSRRPLRVSAEQIMTVPPLALPNLGRLPPLDELTRCASVELFIQRAQARRPEWRLTEGEAPGVAAICARLDGLPLAIELAAARLIVLPPRALLVRLDHSLRLLTNGAADLPERQRTLRGAIAASYELLHSGEQALLRRLAIFAGGCSLEAVEAVCGVGADLEGDLLDWLEALVENNLLLVSEQPDGEPRFSLLETIREFGLEQLAASGEEETLRQAHAAYFLALAEQAEPQLTGPRQGEWLDQLEREHDNLRAALRWAREGGARQEVGVPLAAALWWFWDIRNHYSEGRTWLHDLLAGQGAQELSRAAAAARAKALLGAGNLAKNQSDFAQATTLLEQSVTLFRELDDRHGMTIALNNLATVAYYQGDYTRATALHQENLALRREVGDTRGIASSLNNLGLVAREQGNHARATTLYDEALAVAREMGDKWLIAGMVHNLGIAAHDQGDHGRATSLFEECLAGWRELGDTWGIAVSLQSLGLVAEDQGDFARARVLYEKGLALWHDLGDQRSIASSLEGLASVAAALEAPRRAAQLLGAAATLRATIGAPVLRAECPRFDRLVAALHAILGEAAWAAEWAAGQALSTERALALAMPSAEAESGSVAGTPMGGPAASCVRHSASLDHEVEIGGAGAEPPRD